MTNDEHVYKAVSELSKIIELGEKHEKLVHDFIIASKYQNLSLRDTIDLIQFMQYLVRKLVGKTAITEAIIANDMATYASRITIEHLANNDYSIAMAKPK